MWTDDTGEHTTVIDGRQLVGSAARSGIVIQDGTVSRLHAEFEARRDGLWVRDLGSRNGTYVEGLQVSGARVPDHGKVRLGAVELVVDYEAEPRKAVPVWREARFGRLVGTSLAMRELFAALARISPLDAPVLIQGETGTGKELVAQAIHDASTRAGKPFVVVDCAALPENLLDAELFGHAQGAFSGATTARAGAVELADGGTVFLDEIGELPISMQPKLLRVLESKTVRRLGETTQRQADVRFISSTHRDLLTMVSAGEFREDLYFRLAALPISVPALRDRREDIELLVNHFLEQSKSPGSADPELLRELLGRPWRGNVRELRNFVERARALGADQALAMSEPTRQRPPVDAVAASEPTSGTTPSKLVTADEKVFDQKYRDFRDAWLDLGEREYVQRLLARHERNVSAAARAAEIHRTYIYRLIRKHEI
ncbi:Response regulator of zinc sigma-54-dependent two-component system [Labilithrix luteola]|uniref:Response regulator of zinc sigma-54-dependent two-component system n=1 Tax=Labilithrix luteola TaxID=1391654 RepID=A0A0K1Q2P1_9BACT|nr:Response regulator of zinc sigma-54-dependent two-component system [Labilithrix luteola]